jgi:formiminotetrahydrofolate cyclodeaminase
MDVMADRRVGDLLDELASKTPAPGGGAAAALTAATAAALTGMVIAYSLGKKSLAEHQHMLEGIRASVQVLREEFLRLAGEDMAAYTALQEIQKLPETDPRRAAEEPAAVVRAIEAPRRVLDRSRELLDLIASLVGKSNTHLRSDLAVAAVLAEAAAASAAWNVRINAPLLPEAERPAVFGRMEAAVEAARQQRERVERACG